MGVSRYNSEGYYDPTAYEALTKIAQEEKTARYRPLVYICSPYSGDTEGNTEKSKAVQPVRCGFRYDPHCAASAVPAVPIRRNGTGACDFHGSGAAGQM